MTIDVTYQCRRKIKQTYQMKEGMARNEMNRVVVHDKHDPGVTFCDECKECGYGNVGVNITTGDTVVLCKLKRVQQK